MALDPYSLCPCGNGQKIKFCCSADIISDLDKVMRMIEGEQRVAALDQLNRLLEKRPQNPALLCLKAQLQLSFEDLENAEKTVQQFLAVDPKNPNALALSAILISAKGQIIPAVERLQAAVEVSDGRLGSMTTQAFFVISEGLYSAGHFLGAYGHALTIAAAAPTDEVAQNLLRRYRGQVGIPLLMRWERFVRPAPADAPWKAKFDEAATWAAKGCWLKACEQFLALAERVPNEAAILYNVAVLRGLVGDTSGAVLWWHKYATLEAVPLEDRVEAEALAQLIDVNAPQTTVDLVETQVTLTDVEKAMERLLADKRLVARNREEFAEDLEEGEVPPKAVFTVLDRPMPATGEGIALADVPRELGHLFVYGRQTDREPLAEFACERTPQREAALMALRETLGEYARDTQEKTLGTIPEERVALQLALFPPKDTTRDHFNGIMLEAQRQVLFDAWPRTRNRALDLKSPADVAGQPAYQVRLLACVLRLEQQNLEPRLDFNALRTQLGLPTLGAIDPTGVDVNRLPPWRLKRVDTAKLTDEQLLVNIHRGLMYLDGDIVNYLGAEVLRRSASIGLPDRLAVINSMIRTSHDPLRAAELAATAQNMAREGKQSPAQFMLLELRIRLSIGDGAKAERLMRALMSEHRNEPGVSQALYGMLVEAGIVSPDGRPATAPVAATPEPAAAAAAAGGIWTPGDPVAPPAKEKSGLWLPGMD